MSPRAMILRPMGDRAVLVETDDVPGWQAAIDAARSADEFPSIIDVIPAARTLLVQFTGDAAQVHRAIAGLTPLASAAGERSLVDVDVVYDGPDLDAVAESTGLSREGVVGLHAGTTYDVAFCGFAPGFAYLTGLDPRLRLPRRATPRIRVPQGSVAIAAGYTAIYPRETPGGWHLLGRSAVPLFDEHREPPAVFVPGTRVRFRPVSEVTPARPSPEPIVAPPPMDVGLLEIVASGPSTLVQDSGRPGHGRIAVGASGAFDMGSHDLANRLLGNARDAATLETVGGGLALRALAHVTVCVTGAQGPLFVDSRPVDRQSPLALAVGQTLTIGRPAHGLRSYVGVRGGVDAEPALGSRSRDTLAGLGPAPLSPGDVLAVGTPIGLPHVDHVAVRELPSGITLRIQPGPRWDWFTGASHEEFTGTTYHVSDRSDRVGLRLNGARLHRTPGHGELEPEGLVRGAIQVPPDGQPVILGPDHPVTGGYPVIAVVIRADLDRLAQAPPGTPVRFRWAG